MGDAHRWTGAKPLNRPDETIEQGDVFEPTAAELSAFSDRLTPSPDSDADVEPPVDPGEYSTRELRTHVSDNDYSDEQLQAIADAERAGKERTTIIDGLTPS